MSCELPPVLEITGSCSRWNALDGHWSSGNTDSGSYGAMEGIERRLTAWARGNGSLPRGSKSHSGRDVP